MTPMDRLMSRTLKETERCLRSAFKSSIQCLPTPKRTTIGDRTQTQIMHERRVPGFIPSTELSMVARRPPTLAFSIGSFSNGACAWGRQGLTNYCCLYGPDELLTLQKLDPFLRLSLFRDSDNSPT